MAIINGECSSKSGSHFQQAKDFFPNMDGSTVEDMYGMMKYWQFTVHICCYLHHIQMLFCVFVMLWCSWFTSSFHNYIIASCILLNPTMMKWTVLFISKDFVPMFKGVCLLNVNNYGSDKLIMRSVFKSSCLINWEEWTLRFPSAVVVFRWNTFLQPFLKIGLYPQQSLEKWNIKKHTINLWWLIY